MKRLPSITIPPNTIRIPFLLLAIFGYSLLIAASNFFIIKPQLKRFTELKQRQSSLNETYLQLRATDIEKILQTLQKETAYNQTVQREFAQRCLSYSDYSRVLSDLNRLALSCGLKVLSIDPLPPQNFPIPKYTKKPISLRLMGKYNQFIQLVYGLSDFPYWLLIESINIIHQEPQQELINMTLYTITD